MSCKLKCNVYTDFAASGMQISETCNDAQITILTICCASPGTRVTRTRRIAIISTRELLMRSFVFIQFHNNASRESAEIRKKLTGRESKENACEPTRVSKCLCAFVYAPVRFGAFSYRRTHKRTHTRSSKREALSTSTTKCVHVQRRGALGIPKAEIRGVYVVASVSAAAPWGRGEAAGRGKGEGERRVECAGRGC